MNDGEERVEIDLTEMTATMERMALHQDEEEAVLAVYGGEVGREAKAEDIYLILGDDLPRKSAKAALDRLVRKGWIAKTGSRRGASYTLVAVADD